MLHGHSRTGNTDVVILAIYPFYELGLTEIWIVFGSGKTMKDNLIYHIILSTQQLKDLKAARHCSFSMHTQDVM
jgi:hypothetical protein